MREALSVGWLEENRTEQNRKALSSADEARVVKVTRLPVVDVPPVTLKVT